MESRDELTRRIQDNTKFWVELIKNRYAANEVEPESFSTCSP